MTVLQFPQGKPPKKPPGLSKPASALWDRAVEALGDSLATGDTEALATMCRWYSILDKMLTELESMDITDEGYYRLQVLAGQANSHFTKLANKFGLNPTDRKRIGKPKPKASSIDARNRRA